MNSDLSGDVSRHEDVWLKALSMAAKKFPAFCNTGNEDEDIKEFCAFLSITGAETSFLVSADGLTGYPCTEENGCENGSSVGNSKCDYKDNKSLSG